MCMRSCRFDVTDALAKRGAGPHELLVLATDHTEMHTPERNFPLGKQRMQHTHAGITYTSSSGAPPHALGSGQPSMVIYVGAIVVCRPEQSRF